MSREMTASTLVSAQEMAEQALSLSKADDCMVVVTERS
ncbi:hypothetical protein BH24ACT9_BH24ACT9_06990 [soil metagenome]